MSGRRWRRASGRWSLSSSVSCRSGGRWQVLAIADGDAEIGPGEIADADVVITASAENLFAVVRGVRALAEAEASGDLVVSGDRATAERFFGLFPLSEPAPASG